MNKPFQGQVKPSVFIEKISPSGYYVVKDIDVPGSKKVFDDYEDAVAYFEQLEDAPDLIAQLIPPMPDAGAIFDGLSVDEKIHLVTEMQREEEALERAIYLNARK